MPTPKRIILDIDPGIDDALAVLLAHRSPELTLEALTVVSGNVFVDLGAENALKLVELCGEEKIIVAKGAAYPLKNKLTTAEIVHGDNGLANVELPAPKKALDPRHAVDVIIDLVNANPGEITLVPVAPLTNIALALQKDASIAEKIDEIILMGGSLIGGNVTPAAEANIGNDPEAAKIVFNSGVPITMVELGATHQALLYRSDIEHIKKTDTPLSQFAAQISEFYINFAENHARDKGVALHDPLAVALAIDKSFALEWHRMHIDVETQGDLTYGETVANRSLSTQILTDNGDRRSTIGFAPVKTNVAVPTVIDRDRFIDFFVSRISKK